MLSRQTLQRHLQAAGLPGKVLSAVRFPDARTDYRSLTFQGVLLELQFPPETSAEAPLAAAKILGRLLLLHPFPIVPSLIAAGPDRWTVFVDLIAPFEPPLAPPFDESGFERLPAGERMTQWFACNNLNVGVTSVQFDTYDKLLNIELLEQGPIRLCDFDRISSIIDRENDGEPWQWFLFSPLRYPEYPPISGLNSDYSLLRERQPSVKFRPLATEVAATIRRLDADVRLVNVDPYEQTHEAVYYFQFPDSARLDRVGALISRMQTELPWKPGSVGMTAHGRGRVSAQFLEATDWRWGDGKV